MIQFRKILVPTDFSPASRQAVPYGCELAKQHGAELILCHVLEIPHYPTLFEGTALVVPPIDESLRTQLGEQLRKLAEETAQDHAVPCRAVMRDGPPTQQLLDCAAEEGADLIVIATHGYTGLKHMLLGSTAEQIVRHAPCPVLTIRADLA
jgi:universal stress protein A